MTESFRHYLNSVRLVATTTSLGTLLQHPTIFSVKKLFLMSNLNFSWCSLLPVLLLVTGGRRSAPPFPLSPWESHGLHRGHHSAFSKLKKPSDSWSVDLGNTSNLGEPSSSSVLALTSRGLHLLYRGWVETKYCFMISITCGSSEQEAQKLDNQTAHKIMPYPNFK